MTKEEIREVLLNYSVTSGMSGFVLTEKYFDNVADRISANRRLELDKLEWLLTHRQKEVKRLQSHKKRQALEIAELKAEVKRLKQKPIEILQKFKQVYDSYRVVGVDYFYFSTIKEIFAEHGITLEDKNETT
jgi:septal ring factor EnvC (AmiA/AmiB activator)